MNKYAAAALGGGFCWGFMGFFTRNLTEYGIDANGVPYAARVSAMTQNEKEDAVG